MEEMLKLQAEADHHQQIIEPSPCVFHHDHQIDETPGVEVQQSNVSDSEGQADDDSPVLDLSSYSLSAEDELGMQFSCMT